jgi:hypothetical protein
VNTFVGPVRVHYREVLLYLQLLVYLILMVSYSNEVLVNCPLTCQYRTSFANASDTFQSKCRLPASEPTQNATLSEYCEIMMIFNYKEQMVNITITNHTEGATIGAGYQVELQETYLHFDKDIIDTSVTYSCRTNEQCIFTYAEETIRFLLNVNHEPLRLKLMRKYHLPPHANSSNDGLQCYYGGANMNHIQCGSDEVCSIHHWGGDNNYDDDDDWQGEHGCSREVIDVPKLFRGLFVLTAKQIPDPVEIEKFTDITCNTNLCNTQVMSYEISSIVKREFMKTFFDSTTTTPINSAGTESIKLPITIVILSFLR